MIESSLVERMRAADLRAALTGPDAHPVAFPDAFDGDLARTLVADLAAATPWQQVHYLEEFLGGTRQVTPEEFASASELARFASWQHLDLEEAPPSQLLSSLFSAMSSPSLLEVLGDTGIDGLRPPSFKVRRYGPGDLFGRHSDGGRGLGIMVYLSTPPWRDGDGGDFVYEGPRGVLSFAPRHNSVLVFPYRDDASHLVAPVRPHGTIRYSIGCDYAEQ